MAVAIILGILVGLLGGAAFLVLIQAINAAKIASAAAILTILAQLAIVPALWVGVPILVVGTLRLATLGGFIGPYLAALASSFASIVILPLLAWIRGMAGSWVVAAPEEVSK